MELRLREPLIMNDSKNPDNKPGIKYNMNSSRQEEKALRKIRLLADFTCRMLADSQTTLGESLRYIYNARETALSLFPDKARTFDMIYGRRFSRILERKGKFFSTRYPFWN